MKTLILKNSDIDAAIKYVYDALVQYKLSFTIYNITQILRSSGLYIEHSKVKQWVKMNVAVEAPYRTIQVTVSDLGDLALLYTTLNVDLEPDARIYSTLDNFGDLVEEYIEWFRCQHDFHMPVEADSAEDTEPEDESPVDSITVGSLTRGPDGRFARRNG